MKTKLNAAIAIASAIIAIGAISRLFPHPANFVPVGALAIFSGLYLSKKYAYILPLVIMFLSDLIIGFYDWKIMASVYASFLLMVGIGQLVKRNKKISTVIGGVLSGSLLFFFITNAAVWAFGSMYSHNLNGLAQSYIMAIPFFKNSLMGDVFYSAVFIGIMEAVVYYKRLVESRKAKEIINLP